MRSERRCTAAHSSCADGWQRAAEDRRVRPPRRAFRVGDPPPTTCYLALTVTLLVSVVGRPFVLRTIVNVALPLEAFESFIVIVFFAPTFSFRPAAFPAIPGPVSVAVAPISDGQATPFRV
jgi:hypothetical protein